MSGMPMDPLEEEELKKKKSRASNKKSFKAEIDDSEQESDIALPQVEVINLSKIHKGP